jgi:hypothetical protein
MGEVKVEVKCVRCKNFYIAEAEDFYCEECIIAREESYYNSQCKDCERINPEECEDGCEDDDYGFCPDCEKQKLLAEQDGYIEYLQDKLEALGVSYESLEDYLTPAQKVEEEDPDVKKAEEVLGHIK